MARFLPDKGLRSMITKALVCGGGEKSLYQASIAYENWKNRLKQKSETEELREYRDMWG